MNGTQHHTAASRLPIVPPRTQQLRVPVFTTERDYTAGSETMIRTVSETLHWQRHQVVYIEAEMPDPETLLRQLESGKTEITIRAKLTAGTGRVQR